MVSSASHETRAGQLIRSLEVASFKGKKILVTGGGGFVGVHLGRALHMLGGHVTLFDKKPPIEDYHEDIKFISGDIRDPKFVQQLCEGMDCVFHLASYGMSGLEMLIGSEYIESVNVGGTKNVIEACLKTNVPRIVYTSTLNVVFGGQDIFDGDETLPVLPLHAHKDHYSRTKSIAEDLILKANGKATQDGGILRTCAIRPSAIYGAGEQRHLPRIVKNIEQGLVKVTIGSPDIKTEWVHVDNLVNGHLLAAEAMTEKKEYVAAGEVYFITDDSPINSFEFLRPLIEGLGYTYPKITLPYNVMYCISLFLEIIFGVVSLFYSFTPLMVRTELFQVAVHHTFNITKAKTQLGYVPAKRDMTDVVEYFIAKGHQRKPSVVMYWVTNIVVGLMFAVLIMTFLPMVK
ncbi:short-chain dehydrogenase/reductase family 42E member 1-like [Amphiura filiformis]|uniref:short-chain dehydrogenase/reductase family 42E member 1-like n=1 Tax=Amphiura filiformis TaxID=82378 RepID=UPI003B2218B7